MKPGNIIHRRRHRFVTDHIRQRRCLRHVHGLTAVYAEPDLEKSFQAGLLGGIQPRAERSCGSVPPVDYLCRSSRPWYNRERAMRNSPSAQHAQACNGDYLSRSIKQHETSFHAAHDATFRGKCPDLTTSPHRLQEVAADGDPTNRVWFGFNAN